MPIPQTRTRLKAFVTIRSIVDPATGIGGLFIADANTLVNNLGNAEIVGAAQQLIINQDRVTNSYRREFDPARLGKPVETIPGLPEYKITLQRVDLYDENMLEAFRFTGINIVNQFSPIVIVAEQPVPLQKDGVTPLEVNGQPMIPRTYVITGCWFDNMPLEFDAMAEDQKFVQEVTMIAQDVFAL